MEHPAPGVTLCQEHESLKGERGHCLRNVQIHFTNGFSCWLSCIVTAVVTRCLLVGKKSLSYFFIILFCVFFNHRYVFISRSGCFENLLEYLPQDGKCWCQTQGFGVPIFWVWGTICSCSVCKTIQKCGLI